MSGISNVETFNGEIKYGNYTGNVWYGFKDVYHPQVQNNIQTVLSKPELFNGFELYLTGGILEGWLTWDLDWSIVGPYHPERIKKVIDWITQVGFKQGIYPDVTYAEEIFDLFEWQQTRVCKDRWIYKSSNFFSKNGEETNDLSNYILTDAGLYKFWAVCPFQKNIEKDQSGHKYQKPLKLL